MIDEWVGSVLTAFFVSTAYSVFLVDMVKVLCLSLTSATALAGSGYDHLLPPSAGGRTGAAAAPKRKKKRLCEWTRTERRDALKELARRALRRLHKVLDLLG